MGAKFSSSSLKKKKRKNSNEFTVDSGLVPIQTTSNSPMNNNLPVTNASSPKYKIVKALYSYDPVQSDELLFKKGDKIEVLDDELSNDWWLGRHMTSNIQGYIPSNYVTEDNDSPETQDWWFSIDRREANKQLMLPGNPAGTFLIRNSADLKSYALSIRVYKEFTQSYDIKHYRIKRQATSGFVYISESKKFDSMLALVQHYKDNMDGLCSRLLWPCPKEALIVPFKNLEVDRSSIQLMEKLGAGQFGEVWKGKWMQINEVAVKTLKPGSMTAAAFLDEAKTMNRLRHRKLVILLGVCTVDEPIYIITELMSNGALLDYLRRDEGRTINIAIVIDMAAQIADGMAYLEAQSFIHRDLRAANILVGDNNTVKVADFGLARILDQEDTYDASKETKFPIKWTSPEAAYEHKFSVKSDVWSYGILLYEIVTYGRLPYPGMDGATTLEKVVSGYRMPRPTGRNFDCPPKIYEMMLKCWSAKPAERPTFVYLLNFFDDYATESEEHYRPPESN